MSPPYTNAAEVFMELLSGLESNLPALLDQPERWSSLDVNYEPPRVERLWMDLDGHRVYLHRIHPCEKALYHPHPWPSAIKIVSGSYEMGVGYGVGDAVPPEAARVRLAAGSSYVMVEPDGWHYVRPLGPDPSLSLMVTGERWQRWSPKPNFKLHELSPEDRLGLLASFKSHYPRR